MADAEVEPVVKDSESTDKSEKKTKKKTSTKKTKDSTKEKKTAAPEPNVDEPTDINVPNGGLSEDQSPVPVVETETDEVPMNDIAAPEESYSSQHKEPVITDHHTTHGHHLPIAEHPVQLKTPELIEEIDENKLLELQEAFLLFDLNQDGYIDKSDLLATYKTLGIMDITEIEVTKMLAEATCPMDFDSFVTLLGYKTVELDAEETLIDALSKWDKDNSGLISEDQIRHDLMTKGDKFSEKEVDYALEEAPIYFNKKGKPMIDYISFCKSLSGLRKKKKVTPPAEGGEFGSS